jgi:hypothetical protein
MTARSWLAVIALLLFLPAAGCTNTGTASDDKRSVFYGGISAGGARP